MYASPKVIGKMVLRKKEGKCTYFTLFIFLGSFGGG